ncbi:MAG TPA: hypothetical protein DCF63_05955 [Planctomycetaceae bacterium]|nr:hypothetical protein [Planctomycetaceae bacterium]
MDLQSKVRAGGGTQVLDAAELARYNELLSMVKKRYKGQLTEEQIDTLVSAAPEALVEAGGHFHHVLPKLGRLVHRDRILALQRMLWFDHGIDPIMSVDFFVIAPTKGVHTNPAIEHVIERLEDFFEEFPAATEANKKKVLELLEVLGDQAQQGFQNLRK